MAAALFLLALLPRSPNHRNCGGLLTQPWPLLICEADEDDEVDQVVAPNPPSLSSRELVIL